MSDCPSLVFGGLLMLKTAFDEYASKDPVGPKDKLSKKELKELLKKELGLMPQKEEDATFDNLLGSLDSDGDGQMDFSEFLVLLVPYGAILSEAMSGEGV